MSYMPKQNIPESQKDKKWMIDTVRSIVQLVDSNSWMKLRDRFCYDLYYGIINESDYNYLTKVGEYQYPAKVRFVPLIRPKLDRLASEETKRPFPWHVYAIDKDSLLKKKDHKSKLILDVIRSRIMMRRHTLITTQQQMQQQQIQQQQLQQQPQQTPPPSGMIPPDHPLYKTLMDQVDNELLITAREIKHINQYYMYEHRDFKEIMAHKGLKFLMAKYDIREVFSDGFIDELVTDKEIYKADWNGYDEDPELRKVNILNFYHSGDDDVKWVDQCHWAVEIRYMTVNQIVDEFKHELTDEDYKRLQDSGKLYDVINSSYYNYADRSVIDNSTENCAPNNLYSGTENYSNKIRVAYLEWQVPRELRFKRKPNPHDSSSEFIKMMEPDDTVRESQGERSEARYINDIYEGVMIDQHIFPRTRKKPVQLRGRDNLGSVGLSYIGYAHNGINRKPYSIVWATREIQLLYNLLHYHKELWIALSGVKGFIMDKAQLPAGMSYQEWLYQRKLGVGWIESARDGRQTSTFNQLQHFDDSISPGIQYLMLILKHLEDMAEMITGVSRPRMGNADPATLVGVAKESVNQSSLVTEMIFYRHDQVKKRALSRYVNLMAMAWKKGRMGQYSTGDFGQDLLDVPENSLIDAEYDLFIADSFNENQSLRDLKQLAIGEHNKGVLDLGQLVKLYSMDSIRELEKSLEYYSELAEQKAAGRMQGEAEMEQQKIKMDGEIKAMLQKQEQEFKSLDVELNRQKLEWEKQRFDRDAELRNKEIELNASQKDLATRSERDVELLYLQQQKMASDKGLELKERQLEMGAKGTGKISTGIRSKEKIID